MAEQLRGKIMFLHGLLDIGCHPSALFRLTDALAKANKDFDLVLDVHAAHRSTGYTTRRSWDFFQRHLAGKEPPRDIAIVTGGDLKFASMMKKQADALAVVERATAAEG